MDRSSTTSKTPQRLPKDKNACEKLTGKLSRFCERTYINLGAPESLMNIFHVAKADDIRPAFDASKNGYNKVVYAPWFPLPTCDTMLRTLDVGYWGSDNDFGELFYNFWMHPDSIRYSGINLGPFFPDEAAELWEKEKRPLHGVWVWPPMGEGPSPYGTVQQSHQLKRKILGDPKDSDNVFGWDQV